MKIEVLGCHGSETPSAKSVGFLINDHILLEAGTASSVLSLERQKKVHDVMISHLHLDHIKSLPFLADNRIGEGGAPLTVYGIREVIEGLKAHVFNNAVWPDFSRIENGQNTLLQFRELVPRRKTRIREIEILPIAVNHSVPSVGLFIRQQESAILYTGDTAPSQEIWEMAAESRDLVGIIVETSFPDRMKEIAAVSGHMTPSTLTEELQKLSRPEVPIYIFHMKPKYETAIMAELDRLLGDRIHILQEGETIHL